MSKSKETLAKQEGVVRRASTLTSQSRERRAALFDGDSDQDDPEEAAIKRINRARAAPRDLFPKYIERTRLEANVRTYDAIVSLTYLSYLFAFSFASLSTCAFPLHVTYFYGILN